MTIDTFAPTFSIAVVGAGTMGRGIAQIAAASGVPVALFDQRQGAAEDALGFVRQMLGRAAEKGQMSREAADAAVARVRIAGRLEALAPVDLVIEAVIEDLAAKQELFARLEGIVGENCILASNTSSFSITAIGAACKRPQRVAGYHFFNPVPLMKVVEVVAGTLTERVVTDALAQLAVRMGHRAVRTEDTPGFIVNHAGRGLYTEGARIVAEGITDFAGVDDILREGGPGFRMGPFELMDTTGLDVSKVVSESIYHQYYEEPRVRPQAFMQRRVAGGLFGRKTGRGFYVYADGKKIAPPVPPAPKTLPKRVWISPAEPDAASALAKLCAAAGVTVETSMYPGPTSLAIVAPLGPDTTTTALAYGIEPKRTVAIDTMFGLGGRRTLMASPATDLAFRDQAHALLAAGGAPVTVIHDSPGFVAQRVIATIINIVCEMAQARIATPADIDDAVRLGLAYPKGPFAWGDALGPRRILAILDAMHDFYRDPRYRPSPWLIRRARLGLSLAAAES